MSRQSTFPSNNVRIVEVGPRDGLQNIKTQVPTRTKIELIHKLVATGLSVVEATSFVSPKLIPQMADCREILAQIRQLYNPNLRFPVLVPTLAHAQKAISNGAQELAVFVSATEGFSKKNTGCTVDEGLSRARQIAQDAKKHGIPTRG
jgi:hydroxymethylglutaryl-CoA lyase